MTAKEPITKQPSVVQNTAGETGGKIDTNQLLAAQKTEDQEKLPLGLKTLSGTSEVTVKQHIDSVEGTVISVLMGHCKAKAKLFGVLYNQSSSIPFDETSSYWSVPKNS